MRELLSGLIQEFEGKEHVLYYLNRRLLDVETRYSPTEKLCLCLYFSCTKLRHYLLSAEYIVVCKDDVVKNVMSLLILNERISKWILALSEFRLSFKSAKVVKGQFITDFVTHHCVQKFLLWNLLHGPCSLISHLVELVVVSV